MVVKIVVGPIVLDVANPASTMNQNFFEPAVLWAEWVVVAEVPFPEKSRLVPTILERVRNGRFAMPQ